MLKFKQTATTKSPPPRNPLSHSATATSINPAFSNVKCEPCKAAIIIHNITIPLAWPASEYFDHKGEWREFNVCLSLKAAGGTLIKRSKIHQRVNRTITDLQFDESFIFSDLDPDFTIEALVSAKRINNNARLGSSSSPFQSLTNTVSRSFGRRFGANYKKYSQAQSSYTISAYNFPSREEIFSSPFEDLLPVGRCFFRLENAGLSGKIRVYSLALVSAETINPLLPSSDLLPLFGTMCSQVLCVPDCLQITFIRSILDIFYVDEQLLLEKLECALEGGRINCFTKDNKKEAALIIPIDQRTKLHTTAYQTALRITLLDDETKYTQDFIFILSNNNQITDWSYSLKQQITNATAWKEFASISTNPFALKYGSNEFMKKSFDDTLSIKGRTMTNTDEIRGGFKSGGLREVSKRGDRRRVQSVFKDIPKNEEITEKSKNEDVKKLGEKIQNQSKETNEYSKLKSESKEDSKLKITSISKPSLKYPTSNKTSAPKQQQQVSEIIQRPKIVETKPTPKPRSIDSPSTAIVKPRLIDPSSLTANNSSKMPPSKQVVLVNHGYVSSQTKTSPRIARKEQQPPTIIPPGQSVTTSVKYVDSVKSVAEKEFENEPKPRQKVKLEFKEDSVEQSRLPPPPRPHRVSRPLSSESGGTNSNNKTTAIPVIIENSVKKSGNNNNSIKVPPNTYVIRLKVGMEDDDSDGINRDRSKDKQPPPPYSTNRFQQHPPPPTQTTPFTRPSKLKPFNNSLPSPPPLPPSVSRPHQNLPQEIRQIIHPSLSSNLHSSSKSPPKFFKTNFDTEITRL